MLSSWKSSETQLYLLQVFIRRESSVQGPLNPLQIKDIVIQKYREVSLFCLIFKNSTKWYETLRISQLFKISLILKVRFLTFRDSSDLINLALLWKIVSRNLNYTNWWKIYKLNYFWRFLLPKSSCTSGLVCNFSHQIYWHSWKQYWYPLLPQIKPYTCDIPNTMRMIQFSS